MASKKAKAIRGDQDPKRLARRLRRLSSSIRRPGPYEDLWLVLSGFANAIEGGAFKGKKRPPELRDAIAKCRKYCYEAPDYSDSPERDSIAVEVPTKTEVYEALLSRFERFYAGKQPECANLRAMIGGVRELVSLIDPNLLRDPQSVETWRRTCEVRIGALKNPTASTAIGAVLRLAGVTNAQRETLDNTKLRSTYQRKRMKKA